jgi:thermitase
MRTASLIAVLAVAPLLLICQEVIHVLPTISHRTTAPADEASLVQPIIQSVTLEDTAASARDKGNTLSDYTPNDTYFSKQWAFNRIKGWRFIPDSPEVLVAILDTGIDLQHEDLAGKVVGDANLTDSPTASDLCGHGTHVAGIVAATANNGVGIAGLAPNCRLLCVKVADDSGVVWPSTIAKGIMWAVDNGAKIINMSLVVPTSCPALEEAVNYASGRGVVLIAAAGNGIKSIPVYPAYYQNVIAVAATDSDGELWSKSNYGDWVDVYAPGVDIYSTLPSNSYGYQSGTSMAAAYATAAAALVLDKMADAEGNGCVHDEVSANLRAFFGAAE